MTATHKFDIIITCLVQSMHNNQQVVELYTPRMDVVLCLFIEFRKTHSKTRDCAVEWKSRVENMQHNIKRMRGCGERILHFTDIYHRKLPRTKKLHVYGVKIDLKSGIVFFGLVLYIIYIVYFTEILMAKITIKKNVIQFNLMDEHIRNCGFIVIRIPKIICFQHDFLKIAEFISAHNLHAVACQSNIRWVHYHQLK